MDKPNEKKKKKELILKGYLVEYDNYDRIKLMFLDNSDLSINSYINKCSKNINFTKNYITHKNKYYKDKNPNSYCPIIDEKYFYIKCRKKQKCEIESDRLQLNEDEIKIIQLINKEEKKNKFIKIDIKQAIQNYVECIVEVNEYNFLLKGNIKEGYNFKLKNIKVI